MRYLSQGKSLEAASDISGSQLRTFQRRVKSWRATEVFFPGKHGPGKMSNWETGAIFLSDGFESLSKWLQRSLWELEGVPDGHRPDGFAEVAAKVENREEFLALYQSMLAHYGLTEQISQRQTPEEKHGGRPATAISRKPLTRRWSLRGREFQELPEL